MAETALIIVDWEKEWANPQSEYYCGSDLSEETTKMNQLIAYARKHEYKIVFVKHIEPEGESFKRNTEMIEFIDHLDVRSGDTIIEKEHISSFYKTNLDSELQSTKKVIVAGILINLCVRGVVEEVYDRGMEITMVTDCCIAFNNETHNFTMKDLKETRPEVSMIMLSDFLL